MNNVTITIFTPSYNRSHLLPRLYESLRAQSFKDFEWIIVDDGSEDDTENIVRTFIKEGKLDIRYIRQENGGKHRAINRGVREAKGELFFIVDSDDLLPMHSLQIISKHYASIAGDNAFGGISGLDEYLNGKIVGSGLPQSIIDCTSVAVRMKYHVKGDLSEVFRTSVMKEFPFPEIEGEKFCPEALIWNRIAAKYKLRYINQAIYIAEYQDGGLTDNIIRIRMKSPVASMMCYAEMSKLNIPFIHKMKAAINYWRFRMCVSKQAQKPSLSAMWLWVIPIAWLLHKKDIKKTTRKL